MLKCNRCGRRDGDKELVIDEEVEIHLVGLAEHANPMNDNHFAFGWKVKQISDNLAFATCFSCHFDALDLLEEFYGGAKK